MWVNQMFHLGALEAIAMPFYEIYILVLGTGTALTEFRGSTVVVGKGTVSLNGNKQILHSAVFC
jgi:hypothetical protein